VITDYLGVEFPVVKHSEVESRRFDRNVMRLTVPEQCKWSDREIVSLATSVEADLLILRSPTSRNRIGGMLGSLPIVRTIHADSLLYFSRALDSYSEREATHRDIEISTDPVVPDELTDLVLATFADYQNHYSANPDLPSGAVQDGYAEWVTNTLTSPDGHLVTLKTAKKVVAFIVYALFRQSGGEQQAEVLLNGTHPAFRNKGLYSFVFSECLSDARSRGAKRMWISTQASHRAMIRTWEKAGLRFELGLNTYHCSPRRLD
jgi:ribosomal protein S18 acetylase RimI-like enzyme